MKRTIPVNDEKVLEIYNEIIGLQKEANPFIDEWQEIEAKKAELKKPYSDYLSEVEPKEKEIKANLDNINSKAEALKEKLTPFLRDLIEPQLADTEDFEGLELIDEVLYANIFDAVELYKEKFVANRLEQKALKVADDTK